MRRGPGQDDRFTWSMAVIALFVLLGTACGKSDPGDGSVVGTFTVGTNPVGLAFDGVSVWVANNGGGVSRL